MEMYPIVNGQRFESLEEAAEYAGMPEHFHEFFPHADIAQGIDVSDYGDGEGWLEASHKKDGWTTGIKFKDFRPVARVESEPAKCEMFPV
jgi:hypothetical protein